MDKYTQNAVNYAISHYKLGLLEEIKELDRKYRSITVTKALNDVLRIMADDVVEQKEKDNEITNSYTNRT